MVYMVCVQCCDVTVRRAGYLQVWRQRETAGRVQVLHQFFRLLKIFYFVHRISCALNLAFDLLLKKILVSQTALI